MPTLDWIGKDKIINYHRNVPYCVLDRIYSYDSKGQHEEDNGSENMIIHGDNLYALKSLLPKYEGKIKCIYIDPPYNTGNEKWVYNDNVNDPQIRKWLGEIVGKEGEDMTRHDKWLCMMYPRLKLLQQLLSQDGAIFISISDVEVSHLKLLCDEVFGAFNFITIAPKKGSGGRQDSKHYSIVHEFVIVYAKSKQLFDVGRDQKEIKMTKFDSIRNKYYKTQLLRKWGDGSRREDRPNLYYPLYFDILHNQLSVKQMNTSDIEIYPKLSDGKDGRWRWEKNNMQQHIDQGNVEIITEDENFIAYERLYEDEVTNTKPYSTWIDDNFESGTTSLSRMFPSVDFPYPKSVDYIEHLIQMCTCDCDCTVLDSFAGTGTTGHAVINLNNKGGNRKFILIEMMDYAESITAQRIKFVIDGYCSESHINSSFSYYELGNQIMNEEFINEDVPIDKIREYVFYTETKTSFVALNPEFKYYLGKKDLTAYYFCYEKDKMVSLDESIIAHIEPGFDNYVVYADVCYLSSSYLKKHNIVFKKIPRDIGRF